MLQNNLALKSPDLFAYILLAWIHRNFTSEVFCLFFFFVFIYIAVKYGIGFLGE